MLKTEGMKLKRFLEDEGLTPFTFGPKINVHPMTVYRYLRGAAPTVEIAKRIIDVSGGKVALEDLVPDEVA